MPDRILVTGGAGFIGSFIVDAALEAGLLVRVMDSLDPQVHGPARNWPDYLDPRAERLVGDVRRREDWERALDGVDYVSHQAATVGVGQSMYEIARYMEVNTQGTALLLDVLAQWKSQGRLRARKIMVASSMSNYGEGLYECPAHGRFHPLLRTREQLQSRRWDIACPECGQSARPVPTTEETPLHPTSFYALSKQDQEIMTLLFGRAYGVPVTALRYFNVYGPRQALSNPYTGVAAIFSSRLLNGQPPLVFEDGRQCRDFIHVRDIARANMVALTHPAADGQVFNVGVGRPLSLLDMSAALQGHLGLDLAPEILGRFREGDIRHCYSDSGKIKRLLGFEAAIPFERGVADLVDWVRRQSAVDKVAEARQTLERRGLAW